MKNRSKLVCIFITILFIFLCFFCSCNIITTKNYTPVTFSTLEEKVVDTMYVKKLINNNQFINYPNIYLKHYYVVYTNGDEEEITATEYCQYIKGDTIVVTSTYVKYK